MSRPEKFFSLSGQSKICSEFEVGKISSADFLKYLQSKCRVGTSLTEVKNAWCINQRGVTPETVAVLGELQDRGLNLFILSNTNPIHIDKVENCFVKAYSKELKDFFKSTFYSFNMKLRKPNIECYQYVVDKANIMPSETLYIDDLESNLEAPRLLGFRCLRHVTNSEISVSLDFLS